MTKSTGVSVDGLATVVPPLLTVEGAASLLGIGRSLAYDLIRRGEFPSPVLRVGKLIKIPSAPLLDLMWATTSGLTREQLQRTDLQRDPDPAVASSEDVVK